MKASTTLSAVANVAVILAIGFYFWGTAGPNAGQRSFDGRSVPVRLSADEWQRLTHGGSRLGNADASAVLVEFIDYQCSYCSIMNPIMEHHLRSHPDHAIVIRHYPLSIHPAAERAARAAICAEAQGKFAGMHSMLFESEDWQTGDNWNGLVEKVGIANIIEFDRCLDSAETRARIEADRVLATEFGVTATPTFISRSSIHVGSLDRWMLSRLASMDPAR